MPVRGSRTDRLYFLLDLSLQRHEEPKPFYSHQPTWDVPCIPLSLVAVSREKGHKIPVQKLAFPCLLTHIKSERRRYPSYSCRASLGSLREVGKGTRLSEPYTPRTKVYNNFPRKSQICPIKAFQGNDFA